MKYKSLQCPCCGRLNLSLCTGDNIVSILGNALSLVICGYCQKLMIIVNPVAKNSFGKALDK